MKKIVVIDNYDSFTFNLVHYLEDLDCEVTVLRNDKFHLDDIKGFDKILLSPGPGVPKEAGLLNAVIKQYASTKSILGVCLGQQAIGDVFGGQLVNLKEVYHGVHTDITVVVKDEILFNQLGPTLQVGRYHSWVVDANLPDVLEATSIDDNGQVMSLRHKIYDVKGVQFHPESVLTPHGKQLLKNWITS
ncbi:MAG: aminodeoxychorismate/anthranilate synthase component II [Formosa sp.]|jgi:anthranilate synthase component II|nr:aminodeoxychorismate/anthranilate synthase component II [Formosa sp.]MDC0463518.1 aminodeoxychorismate/anthranilate synthase component II [Flavobacteriaceae bacterium]